jgi:hypothetical protein
MAFDIVIGADAQPATFAIVIGTTPSAVVPGAGTAGVVTLLADAESGSTLTLAWTTDVLQAWDGTEQRVCVGGAMPRQRYEFASLLTDVQQRAAHGVLARLSAGAPLFSLGLAYEALTVVSSTSSVVTTYGLTLCDWCIPGQRLVAVSPAGAISPLAVVQSSLTPDVTVDVDLSAYATAGARILPVMAIRLDPDQPISRHQTALGRWQLAGRADRVRYGTAGVAGIGVAVTNYGVTPIWDRGIDTDGLTDQPLMTGAELVDLGGKVSAIGDYTAPQWGRTIALTSSKRIDWQWLKAFLHAVRGRWKTFLLPTGRPDLVPVSLVSNELIISGADYVLDWYPSLAHRYLWLTYGNGTSEAVQVSSAEVVTATTQRLYLYEYPSSSPVRVEFLETCRLESDEVTIRFEALAFQVRLQARVVQG